MALASETLSMQGNSSQVQVKAPIDAYKLLAREGANKVGENGSQPQCSNFARCGPESAKLWQTSGELRQRPEEENPLLQHGLKPSDQALRCLEGLRVMFHANDLKFNANKDNCGCC